MSDPNKRDSGPVTPDYKAAAARMLMVAELLFPSDTKGGDRADRKA